MEDGGAACVSVLFPVLPTVFLILQRLHLSYLLSSNSDIHSDILKKKMFIAL